MVFLLIFIFIIILLIEVPNLVNNKYWRELIVFSIFSLTAFILSLLCILDLPIINPVYIVTYFVKDILHLNYK